MPIYKMQGKKDGKQKYRVRVNYTDVTGKARQTERVTFGSEEARQLEKELELEMRSAPTGGTTTLKELYKEFAASRTKSVRETTADKCRRVLDGYVLNTLGDYKVIKLNMPILQKWKSGVDATKLGLRTKKNIYSEFHSLLNYAVKMDYIASNPLAKLGNFKDALQIYERKVDYYTAEEFLKYSKTAKGQAMLAQRRGDNKEWHYYVFFSIAFYTGLRKGEIYGLRWDDITGDTLRVERSVAQKLKGEDRITPPKNKSSIRTLQLPAPLIKILNAHKKRCQKLPGFDEQKHICGFDRALRDTSIAKRNEAYAELAGIKSIRIHDFRHAHASLLINEGINIQEIARRLGHSKIEETWNTYAHLYPREEERAIAVLNKIV